MSSPRLMRKLAGLTDEALALVEQHVDLLLALPAHRRPDPRALFQLITTEDRWPSRAAPSVAALARDAVAIASRAVNTRRLAEAQARRDELERQLARTKRIVAIVRAATPMFGISLAPRRRRCAVVRQQG
jgi:hypothetical protein